MNRGGLDHVKWPPRPRPSIFYPMTVLIECADFKFFCQCCHVIHASVTLPTLVFFLLFLCLLLLHHCFIFSPLFQMLHRYLLCGALLCSSYSHPRWSILAAIVFIIILLPMDQDVLSLPSSSKNPAANAPESLGILDVLTKICPPTLPHHPC